MINPVDHQGLLLFAISKARSVNAEFSSDWLDVFRLRAWAMSYAAANGLKAPDGLESYGRYSDLDKEEIDQLEREGLLLHGEWKIASK